MKTMPELTDTEMLRYARQILLDGWDIEAQTRLKHSRILIIGMGGLGCPVADTLVRAGVGELFIVDGDTIEASNLQRQTLFTPADIGKSKVQTAKQRLTMINELVNITAIEQRLNAENLSEIVTLIQNNGRQNINNQNSLSNFNQISNHSPTIQSHQAFNSCVGSDIGIDLILDCSDNFATREFINRVSVGYNIPLLSASAIGQEGQLALFEPSLNTGCYHCLFPNPNDGAEDERRCVNSGVLASTTAIMGNLQAQAGLTFLGLQKNSLAQTLLLWQGESMTLRKLKFQQDTNCTVCG